MATPESLPPEPTISQQPSANSEYWRPPHSERLLVATMSALLAAALAFVIVFAILQWEVKTIGWNPNRRYSTRDPLLMGLLAGLIAFAVTWANIFLWSLMRIRGRVGRLAVAFGGAILAGYLGSYAGYETVSEYAALEDRLLNWRMFHGSEFAEINEAKAALADLGTAADCAAYTGASLYKLFDRRNGGQAKDEMTDPGRQEAKA